MRGVVVQWGRVTQDLFDDEPGQPNFAAWTRFEVWLMCGSRRVPLWRGPIRWR